MDQETERVKPLMSCPKCGAEMRILGIEAEGRKRDLYTFVCESCDTLEVRGVRIL
jgi:hypothetical protein